MPGWVCLFAARASTHVGMFLFFCLYFNLASFSEATLLLFCSLRKEAKHLHISFRSPVEQLSCFAQMQFFSETPACKHFMEDNASPKMSPKIMVSLQIESCIISHPFSESSKWMRSDQNAVRAFTFVHCTW